MCDDQIYLFEENQKHKQKYIDNFLDKSLEKRNPIKKKKKIELIYKWFSCCLIDKEEEDYLNFEKDENNERISSKQKNKHFEKYKAENSTNQNSLQNQNNLKKLKNSNSFIFYNSLINYPKNQIFFLENKNFIITAKLTTKNFSFNQKNKRTSKGFNEASTKKTNFFNDNNHWIIKKYNGDLKDLFSLYYLGIKLEFNNLERNIPEKIAEYLAKRVKIDDIVIEVECHCGSTAIQVII